MGIIETIHGHEGDGVEVVISRGERGFHASFRDTDADQTVATKICPTIEAARAIGRAMLFGKDPF